jgi:hypothetical protein
MDQGKVTAFSILDLSAASDPTELSIMFCHGLAVLVLHYLGLNLTLLFVFL